MIKTITIAMSLMIASNFVSGQTSTNYIVVDQFGYRPNTEKIAVIRDPHVGFDASESFQPGRTFALINVEDGQTAFEAGISEWQGGAIDDSSGDKCWWFDFTSFTKPGEYYVLDVTNNVKSFSFVIADDVYAEILKQAMRTFFYQRAGYTKGAEYAGDDWSDDASHLGSLQDGEARKFDESFFSTSERDLRGGWYDAGDYNKYTQWTASYIIEFLQAYEENPDAWSDSYCLPYSGNSIPDIIDEVKWGLDYLLRLQESDGSLISIVSLDGAYPPSEAKGQSLYGGVNSISAFSGAAAYAYGSKVFGDLGWSTYSDSLLKAAEAAWMWGDKNPDVIWKNNDAAFNSVGIGAGQQETDDYGRLAYSIRAAIYLFEATEKDIYRDFVEENYKSIHLMAWSFAYAFEEWNQEALLYYANLEGASAEAAADIRNTYTQAMESENNFQALTTEKDPYLSFLNDYVWGSNATKARKGLMFTDYEKYELNASQHADALRAAERYVHYIHGVNPLNFCYLSNMKDFGADQGVTQFYHTWFADGSPWDIVGQSDYGPPPGYVVGGANASYDWDDCCNSSCSSNCDSNIRNELVNEPDQKSYKDFNTSWPMNSWELSENSCGYQVSYIRLLSHFVDPQSVQNTVCNIDYTAPLNIDSGNESRGYLFPSPTEGILKTGHKQMIDVEIFDIQGKVQLLCQLSEGRSIDVNQLEGGLYIAKYHINGVAISQKIIIQ